MIKYRAMIKELKRRTDFDKTHKLPHGWDNGRYPNKPEPLPVYTIKGNPNA